MPRLISRALSSYHIHVEIPEEKAVFGVQEISQLVNGESSPDKVGELLRQLHASLPTPKFFEVRLAQAVLSLPLRTSHSYLLVSEMVLRIVQKKQITIFPSVFRQEVQDTLKPIPMEFEEEKLFKSALQIVFEHNERFLHLLNLVNFKQKILCEELFRFILESHDSHFSTASHKILYQLRNHCPDHLTNQLHITLHAHDLNSKQKRHLSLETSTKLWEDIQSFSGRHVLKGLFEERKWKIVADFPKFHIPPFIQKCMQLRRHTKYPQIWNEWILQTPLNAFYPFIIQQLFVLKDYSSLIPMLALNQTTLIKTMQEQIKGLDPGEFSRFCLTALRHVSPECAEPYLRPRLQSLTMIDEELQEYLLPFIKECDVPLWFDRLDESRKTRSLPPLFEAEKQRRALQSIKDKIQSLQEPDDDLLNDPVHRHLVIRHVLSSDSFRLKVWLIEHGNLDLTNYIQLLISAYRHTPNALVEAWLNDLINMSSSLEMLADICLAPNLTLSQNLFATLKRTVSRLPPQPRQSIPLLKLFMENANPHFPWNHYFALMIHFPHESREIAKAVNAMFSEFKAAPLFILELIAKTLDAYRNPSTLIELFEFAANFPGRNLQDACNAVVEKMVNHYPQGLAHVRRETLIIYFEKRFNRELDEDTCMLLGRVFSEIEISSPLKGYAQKYCRHLMDHYFGDFNFMVWSKDELQRREIEWSSLDRTIDLDITLLSKHNAHPPLNIVNIPFDARSLQRRIIQEQQQAIENVPAQAKDELLHTIQSTPLSEASSQETLVWSLRPKKNKELLYILIEEAANWIPAVPYATSFKNTFCRSLIRDVFHALPSWDYRRLQSALMSCFKSNTLPWKSVTTMETWGFTDLALHLATFAPISAHERGHYTQCISIIMTGSVCKPRANKKLNISAFEKVFLDLIEADSLHMLFSAEVILDTNRDLLTEPQYKAYKLLCSNRKASQLPKTLSDSHLCSSLLQHMPGLLFNDLSLFTSGILSVESQRNVCRHAAKAYILHWVSRAQLPNYNFQQGFINDVTHFRELLKLGKALDETAPLNELCSKWSIEFIKWIEEHPIVNPEELKRLGLTLLLMFQFFEGYYEKIPDLFFPLWKMSRNFLCPSKTMGELMQHNRLTQRYKHILRANTTELLLHLHQESASFQLEQKMEYVPHFLSSFTDQLNSENLSS